MQHKCKVFKCNLAFSTSKKYNIFQYYKIKIFHNYKKQYLYIRYSYSNNGNFPFDNFYKNILNNNNFHPNSIFIKTVKQNTHLIPPKRELNLEFYKYIDIYPNIIQLFENDDYTNIKIGLEILKQQLKINIQ
jgi:hypothetical protein